MHYCYKNLTEKDIDFFQSLSIAQEIKLGNTSPILACHGSPNRNNEKMLPDNDNTNQLIDKCPYQYILCGHTHIQDVIKRGNKVVLNPGAVGVPLHSSGKAQFMILRQSMQDWTYELMSIDYDKEKVIREMQESGLEDAAPYWTQVTNHLILTGEVSHGTVLAKAMNLWKAETGSSDWYDIPNQYWEKAIRELLIIE